MHTNGKKREIINLRYALYRLGIRFKEVAERANVKPSVVSHVLTIQDGKSKNVLLAAKELIKETKENFNLIRSKRQ